MPQFLALGERGKWNPVIAHEAGKFLGTCLARLLEGKYPIDEADRRLDELRALAGRLADPPGNDSFFGERLTADQAGVLDWLESELPEFAAEIGLRTPGESLHGLVQGVVAGVGTDGKWGPARYQARRQARKRRNRKRNERRKREGPHRVDSGKAGP
jgi:hypothetical protein